MKLYPLFLKIKNSASPVIKKALTDSIYASLCNLATREGI